ncbi:MAG: hypothetical protein HFI75_01485 [Lachnospiraceae bacterium]|nr:hypothetical protein [Lachnospiraceae bacterium]
MFVIWGVSEAISFAISSLYEMSFAAEIAREKSAELTDNWVQENSSINSSISRYTELKQKLDDTSLSAAEVKNVKEELLKVQNELTDKYGQEALGIDLVNGKYDEQLAKLNLLSKKKASDYVAKNYKNIQSDRDYITETVNLNKKLNFKGSQAKPDDYSSSGFDLKKYLDRYDKLDAKVVETDGQYGMSGTVSLVTSGTREEVYNQLVQLFNDLTEDFGESNEDVNEFKDTLSDIIKDSFDTKQMETSKNNAKKYAEAQILSQNNTRKLYTEAAAAVNNYNEALQSGEGVEAAKKNLDTVKKNVSNAISDIYGAKDIFKEIYNGVDKNAETGYKISSALQTDPSLNAKAEQLKNLTTEDLMKIDFDDKTDSPGEAVLNELMENIGLSKEHLQCLIDKLAELGYVQTGLSELEDDSQPHDRFLNLWNSDEFKAAQESLLQLAKSGSITTDVLESTDSYITLLKRAGTSADDAKSRILEMLTPIQKLNAAGQNVSSLSKAMEEFQTNGYVSAATLESLPEIFKHLNGYDFNLFESIAGDSGRTKEEIQQAFNDILSCYLTDQETLKGITEENKQFYISQLEEMGIANAQTSVNEYLANQNALQNMLDTYEEYIRLKGDADINYLQTLSGGNSQLVNALTSTYSTDYNNWVELISKKAAAYNKFVTAIAKSKDKTLSSNVLNEKGKAQAVVDNYEQYGAAGYGKDTNLRSLASFSGIGFSKNPKSDNSDRKLAKYTKEEYNAAKEYLTSLEQADALKNSLSLDLNTINMDFGSPLLDTSTPDSQASSSSKENNFKKVFNWIETAVSRIERVISRLRQKADSIYSSWSSRNLNLQAELSAVRNEIELQQQAYNRYMQQANSVGLSASWASKVQNGQVDISNITDEDLAERITQYQEWYEKALSCQDAIEELNETVSELYKTSFEHVVTQYDNILSVVEHNKSLFNEYLSQSEQSNYVSGDKNRNSLVQSIGHYENLLSEEKTNISLLEQEKSALLSALGQAVSSGSIAADSQAFTDMQNQVNGIILAIEQAKTSIQGYHNSISGLYETAFDNADSQYSNLLGVIEHQRSMLDEAISQTEEKGYLISTAYYKTLMHTEQDTITQLEQKKNALLTALNNAVSSGAVEVQSQVWYDMCSQIDEVTLSINEANTAMIKYGNSIRDIEWQVFDLQHERISALSSETDFLIELMSNDKLFDDKGKLTKEGMSTMGLYGMDYNANMFQADHYGEELKKIEQQLKQDPDNQDLEKRKQELTELQQEMILAAEDRKQSIINMVEEGIKAELDALKELISTYTDALDAQKDLYDYQKKVSAQTQELASLQKQLEAYEGDTSEENKARIQQLKVSYEEAQQALEDTEYEKYISDQKQLLDELYLEYELTLNQRLDNVDALFADVIANINSEAYNINTTIAEKADSVGYTLSESMRNIWDLSTGSINTVLAVYGGGIQNGIASAATSVNNTLNGICSNIQGMFDKLNSTANTAISVIAGSSAVNSSSASGSAGGSTVTASAIFSSAAASPAPSSSGSSGSPASTPAWGSWFIPRVYSKQKLNIDTSIVDRLKYFNFDAEKPARAGYYYAMGGTGIYTYSANQNEWMLGQMKAHGFSKGGYVADLQKTAYQNGDDIITINTLKRGEAVLTPVQAQQFHKLLARLDQLHTAVDLTERLTDRSQISAMPAISQDTIHNAIQMEVTLPNVQNYADFKYAMQHDKSFEQMVQAMTVKRAAGGSSLKKYKC